MAVQRWNAGGLVTYGRTAVVGGAAIQASASTLRALASEEDVSGLIEGVFAMRIDRDGLMTVFLDDGRAVEVEGSRRTFDETSGLVASTYVPAISSLVLETMRGDSVVLPVPHPDERPPVRGRPTVYLDQNHWSTLTDALHQPESVRDPLELQAAQRIVEWATTGRVILPMSWAHVGETCQQADREARYRRTLTFARLSQGWLLRDPLLVRHSELREALTARYSKASLLRPAVVTRDPRALYESRAEDLSVGDGLPDSLKWMVQAITGIGSTFDLMFSDDHTPYERVPRWAAQFERFAAWMGENPVGPEMKRRRTHAKFIADVGAELARSAFAAGITPSQMSDWTLLRSEEDLRAMASLGLFREVLHEKLSDPRMRWEQNDLIDMMYLTTGVGYCDLAATERSHCSHLRNGLRRLGRTATVFPNLRTIAPHIEAALAGSP